MEDITDIRLAPLKESPYCNPLRLLYNQDGRDKTWDIIAVYDRVTVIVFNITRMVFVLVRQFRPAVYYNCIHPDDRQETINTKKYPVSLGITLELCTGLIVKNKSIKQMAMQKVLDECGYDVPAEKMNRIMTCLTGIGEQAATMTFFFCEVTDDMKTGTGGGVDDEIIEVVEKTISEMEDLTSSPGPVGSPPGLLFCVLWFMHHKAHGYKAIAAYSKPNVQL